MDLAAFDFIEKKEELSSDARLYRLRLWEIRRL
jgi:hypothetical protein